jgi:hypothetical protein
MLTGWVHGCPQARGAGADSEDPEAPRSTPPAPQLPAGDWMRRGLLAERLFHDADALLAYRCTGGVQGCQGRARCQRVAVLCSQVLPCCERADEHAGSNITDASGSAYRGCSPGGWWQMSHVLAQPGKCFPLLRQALNTIMLVVEWHAARLGKTAVTAAPCPAAIQCAVGSLASQACAHVYRYSHSLCLTHHVHVLLSPRLQLDSRSLAQMHQEIAAAHGVPVASVPQPGDKQLLGPALWVTQALAAASSATWTGA